MSEGTIALRPGPGVGAILIAVGVALVVIGIVVFRHRSDDVTEIAGRSYKFSGPVYWISLVAGVVLIGWGFSGIINSAKGAPPTRTSADERTSPTGPTASPTPAPPPNTIVATIQSEDGAAFLRSRPHWTPTGDNVVTTLQNGDEVAVLCRTPGHGSNHRLISWLRLAGYGDAPAGYVATSLVAVSATQVRWCWTAHVKADVENDGASLRVAADVNSELAKKLDVGVLVVARCLRDGPGITAPSIPWVRVQRSSNPPHPAGYVSSGLLRFDPGPLKDIADNRPPACSEA